MKVVAGEETNIREVMLDAVPSLRAFAISLCGDVDRGDNLVQQALLRALADLNSYDLDTDLSVRLFTILHNLFWSEGCERRRGPEDEFRDALKALPPEHREALILVEGSGFSYEEAAKICGCAVGTVKSWVHRARGRLAEILSGESVEA